MKIHTLFYILGLVVIDSPLFCQFKTSEVLSTAGGSSSIQSNIIDWSIGQIVTNTWSANDYIFTQGLHQNNIVVTNLVPGSINPQQIKIYPNPTSDFLIIEWNKEFECGFELYDINGTIVLNGYLNNNSNSIDFQKYPPGVYNLRIFNEKTKSCDSFNIVKL